jgi:AcrR family transcriptional regulator
MEPIDASPASPQPKQRDQRSRRPKGERSRLRLLEATLVLIARDGLSSLTTARIAGEAGFAQSSFYQHFRGLDDCLTEAGRHAASRIRPARPELRERALAMFDGSGELSDVIELFVRAAVGPFLAEPELTKLCHRHQHDPSSFGRAMDQVLERERSELTSVWWALAERAGALPEHYPVVALQAQLAFSMTRGAINALVYGQFSDQELVIRQLCAFIEGGIDRQRSQLDAALGARRR